MKRALSIAGALVSVGFLAASAVVNYLFAFKLGRTPLESYAAATVAIAATGFNGLSPFFLTWSYRAKNHLATASTAALSALCLLYAVTSAFGFAATTRTHAVGAQDAAYQNYRQAQDILAELLEKRKYAAPKQIAALDKQIAATRDELKQYRNRGANISADPQSAFLAQVTLLPEGTIRVILVILFALLIEIGAAVGLFVSLIHLDATRAVPKANGKAVASWAPRAGWQPKKGV